MSAIFETQCIAFVYLHYLGTLSFPFIAKLKLFGVAGPMLIYEPFIQVIYRGVLFSEGPSGISDAPEISRQLRRRGSERLLEMWSPSEDERRNKVPRHDPSQNDYDAARLGFGYWIKAGVSIEIEMEYGPINIGETMVVSRRILVG